MLHTDIPTPTSIRQLAAVREPFCVSIYLPTSPVPTESEPSRIELRNQVAAAARQLTEAGAGRAVVEELEDAIADLIQDRQFWSYLSRSLAIFHYSGHLQTFRVPNVLPSVLEVADRLYIKPLLRAITFPQTAFVLALSQNAARLVEVSPDAGAYVVDVPGLPADAASAVGLPSISGRSPSGRLQGSEGQKVRLAQYSRSVDAAIRPLVTGSGLPLILATAEPLNGIFRGVSAYPLLAAPTIEGNPDERTPEELAAVARPVLDRLYTAQLGELSDLIEARFSEGRGATDLSDIARAATYGAIDTLVVDIDRKIPGYVDEASGAITFDDEDDAHNYGVVDEIARRALLSGARVLAVRADDVPGGGPAAAITRFAV
ncbi:baeRF11 domain-containing protein [Cryobacterium zhongshanensis]|uniref:Uncharacterized protein n=1 Tax=Cryobacterium zhongshanensis TaxID=2928153 RepID=A0AA41UGJ7_9MICO|nr:hypothetical protein [Cryobacterium zhongshanensis]MCI4659015.1 hypothetical protein [Cryobacterium zhongshanensis]